MLGAVMFQKLLQEWDDLLVWLGLKRPKSFRDKLPPAAKDSYDAIIRLFDNRTPSLPTNATIASKKLDGLAPIRSNLWVVNLDSVDAFKVCDFTAPSIHYDSTKAGPVFSSLHVSFYDTVHGSTVNQLAILLDGNEKELTVKIVDKVGSVIESWRFVVRVLAVHPMTVLDYETNDPIKWSVECECLSWDIKDNS